MKQFLNRYMTSSKAGFTVVELVVVIVIIAILATIVLVAYPGYQTRVQNDTRRSDLAQVSAALKAYAQKNNHYIEAGSGCGQQNNGYGYLNVSSGGGGYTKSIIQCLQEGGFLDSGKDYADPSGCIRSGGACGTNNSTPIFVYMKYNCELNGKKVIYLFADLDGEPSRASEINALCDGGLDYGSVYRMNYYVKVN